MLSSGPGLAWFVSSVTPGPAFPGAFRPSPAAAAGPLARSPSPLCHRRPTVFYCIIMSGPSGLAAPAAQSGRDKGEEALPAAQKQPQAVARKKPPPPPPKVPPAQSGQEKNEEEALVAVPKVPAWVVPESPRSMREKHFSSAGCRLVTRHKKANCDPVWIMHAPDVDHNPNLHTHGTPGHFGQGCQMIWEA